MIEEYTKKLYGIRGEQEKGGRDEDRPWFKKVEWEKYKKTNKKNKKLKEMVYIITRKEINNTIKKLQNGKAPRLDEIINKQIKYGPITLWEML